MYSMEVTLTHIFINTYTTCTYMCIYIYTHVYKLPSYQQAPFLHDSIAPRHVNTAEVKQPVCPLSFEDFLSDDKETEGIASVFF